MGTTPLFSPAGLDGLVNSVTGRVLQPADEGYDDARRVHNGLIDRRPAVIVRCRTAADAAAAVRFAREAGLDISVRGGGHNVAGRAVADDAVMIDLAEMRSVEVDPDRRTARAEGGATWADLNAATAEHGLAVTGGAVSTTGIAGLTLGGGLGWLMAKYGLAADNLIAVELVTADGQITEVSETSDPDLFWALRGGGGNFGIATSFTFELKELRTVTGGLIAHPIESAGELFRFYRDAVADSPDDLTIFAGLVHAPDGSGTKLAALVVCHVGEPEQAERDLAPFKSWGSPLVVQVEPMPYPAMNSILDAGYPKGALNYWVSSFTNGLSDDLIDLAVERFASVPSSMTAILFEHFHGAVTRIGVTETAVPHREAGWNMALASVWLDPDRTEVNVTWTRETHAALREHLADRLWLNYLADDQGLEAVRRAYGPNWDRLVEVKRRVDPDNVFHRNHNIPPD
ncbi:MAG: FAD-binding oxidoreductase [Microbacterium sp.]